MTTQQPLTPLYHLPTRTREYRRVDRISVSSTFSSSTGSSSSTSHLVSPISPGGSGMVPVIHLGVDEEEKWDVPTPKAGSFDHTPRQASYPTMSQRGDTKSWWGERTPKLGAGKSMEPDYFTPLRGSILDESPLSSLAAALSLGFGEAVPGLPEPRIIYGQIALDDSPTLGGHAALEDSTTLGASAALDDSPTLPQSDHALGESPTLPSFSLPTFPPTRDFYPRRPAPRIPEIVEQKISMEELLAGPVIRNDSSGWSDKKLGKRPEMNRTRSEGPLMGKNTSMGMSMERSISLKSLGMVQSSTRPRSSSSSTSTSSLQSSALSTHSAPSIPTRSSSKGRQQQSVIILDGSAPQRPPLPPSRSSSLRGSSKPLPQFPSSDSHPITVPTHPALVRTISASRSRPASPLSHPAFAGPSLHRRSTTSSSFSLSLHTVLETPRDLDANPEGSWALRPPPRHLRRSKSQPSLRTPNDNAMTVPMKFRLRRAGSAHFSMSMRNPAPDSSMGSRFFTSLRKHDRSAMRSKLLDRENACRTSMDTNDGGSSGSSSSVLSRPTSIASNPVPQLDFGADFFTPPSVPDFVFPESNEMEEGGMTDSSCDLAPAIETIGRVSKDRIIVPPPLAKKRPVPPEDAMCDIDNAEIELELAFMKDARLALMAMNEAELWSWPDPPNRSAIPSREGSPVPALTSSATASTLNGPLTPPASPGPGDVAVHTPSQGEKLSHGLDVEVSEKRVKVGKGFTPKKDTKTKYRRSIAPVWI